MNLFMERFVYFRDHSNHNLHVAVNQHIAIYFQIFFPEFCTSGLICFCKSLTFPLP